MGSSLVEPQPLSITFKMTERIFNVEECILYSGDISVMDNTSLIASGTVFREVLLWKIPLDKPHDESS